MVGAGKATIAVSQIATGEENGLRIRAYASEDAILWDQENPNAMGVYRCGTPRETWTRNGGYVSNISSPICRVPAGHPEGYLEAFATVHTGFIEAVCCSIDGSPMSEATPPCPVAAGNAY